MHYFKKLCNVFFFMKLAWIFIQEYISIDYYHHFYQNDNQFKMYTLKRGTFFYKT